LIRAEGLVKRAGAARLLRGVSFEVEARRVLGVIGASGSGKSTLLRCLNGLEKFDEGAVECGGVRIEAGLSEKERRRRVRLLRRQVGTVFQHLHLFPHLTVLGNVIEAPVRVLGTPRREAESLALDLLGAVGMLQAAGRYPESLSGGEQQRVAIARALAMRPDVLLFDEPTSALDPRRSNELRATLRDFVARGHTMIVVSHSIRFLEGLADTLLYLEGGEAVECGEAEQLLRDPRDPRTRDFLLHAH
jgi:polar amino acid transport system ATP-binding protein